MDTELRRRVLLKVAHAIPALRKRLVPLIRTADYVSPVHGDRHELEGDAVGDKYFHISNSGITFQVLDRDGPVIRVSGDAFGVKMADIELPTSREDTRELGFMFLESATDWSLHNRYDHGSQYGDYREPTGVEEQLAVAVAEVSGDAHREFMQSTVYQVVESLCHMVNENQGSFSGSGTANSADPPGGQESLLEMLHEVLDATWGDLQEESLDAF